MANRLPKGPIGFKVLGVSWLAGDPVLDCIVAGDRTNQLIIFQRIEGRWHCLDKTDQRLMALDDDEENGMVERCWQGEMERLAIPIEQR